jgi:hypothetical protein
VSGIAEARLIQPLGISDLQTRPGTGLLNVEGLVVQRAEDDLLLRVAAGDLNPKPLTDARCLVRELHLHVVTGGICLARARYY